ncbi:MAG: HDIG domain-containing protein [Elusimicrobia bacterium]|nr:HDIG domain-containing protein [Elusimicrobiota bacterium]
MTTLAITREQAVELLNENVKSINMVRHCLASEAVLRALAKRLGEDEDVWSMAGLLHDVDVELVNGDMTLQGLKSAEMVLQKGLPAEIAEAVKMHNEQASKLKRTEKFHKALAAGETMTGLITAVTLVYPDKKLASVKVSSITKRMKETRFAASVDRSIIMECEDIGIPLAEFAETCLNAMRSISGELGL